MTRGLTVGRARAQLTTDESVIPTPPKRAMTAYLIFCQRHREKIMRSIRPDASQKFSDGEVRAGDAEAGGAVE